MDTSQLYSSTSTGSTMGNQNQSNTGGGRRRRSREIETLSLEIRNYPRDLLQTFVSADRNTVPRQQSEMVEKVEEEEEKDVEFNLGLSLGGRFGVDKPHRGLIRSSSIAGAIPCLREGGAAEEEEEASVEPEAALARTSSLPTLTEEEWRRRKATLRRMEAKRRRSEKQRSVKESGTGEERESGMGLSFRGRLEREQQHLGKLNPGLDPGPGLNPGPAKGKGGFFRSLQGLLTHQQQSQQGCSQGSGESQGGSSSAASELENKTIQGSGSGGEARTPTSSQSMQIQNTMAGPSSSKQSETSEQSRKKKKQEGGMEDMPSVFTIGDGPGGRKVEGILYRYGRGEEVRIMCVCHGTFFSPADFVKHAGGTDVEHPLRHIVVNPSSSSSFP